ncbi:MAG: hypothetical protein FJ319_09965 [SAR202 cluster bacterium]|nr:hypothetical protein [SAR202 cluster bacterium]
MTIAKKAATIPILILLCLGLLTCSCGLNSAPIVGKWEQSGQNGTIEFLKDGRMIVDTGNVAVTGTYEIVGEE